MSVTEWAVTECVNHAQRRDARSFHGAGRAAACVAAALLAMLGPARAQSGSAIQAQLIQEYVDAFKPHDIVPVLIPIGQEAGDVLDKLGEEFVHRRAECFTSLVAREEPSRLPNLDLGAAAALRLGLGLSQLGEADLHALGSNRVVVRFDNVTVQTVSQGALRQAVNAQACPEIARLINKDPEALKQDTFLVGTVFWARSIVRIDRDRQAGAGVSASWLTALASRLGLRLRAEGGGDVDSARTVELSNTEPLPIGFRPAMIRIDPGQRDYRSVECGSNRSCIVEFNSNRESDRKALGDWIDRQLPQAVPGTR